MWTNHQSEILHPLYFIHFNVPLMETGVHTPRDIDDIKGNIEYLAKQGKTISLHSCISSVPI